MSFSQMATVSELDRTGSVLREAKHLTAAGDSDRALAFMEAADISRCYSEADIYDTAYVLSAAGVPLAEIVDRLAHAPLGLAAVVAGQEASRAHVSFSEWWRLRPGNEGVVWGVGRLAPSLSLAEAVVWHRRLASVGGVTSPLLAIAANGGRSPLERAVAVRCLAGDGLEILGVAASAFFEAQSEQNRAAIDEAAQRLLLATEEETGTASSSRVRPADEPLVSVCIPTYKREQWLADALDSVLAQSGVSFEVIVSDNNSPDGTVGLVRRYMERDGRIRLLTSEKNVGGFFNLRRVLGEARGRYVKFLLDDDILLPDCLSKMVPCLEDPAVSLVTSSWLQVDQQLGNPRVTWTAASSPGLNTFGGAEFADHCLTRAFNYASTLSFTMFRREDIAPSRLGTFEGSQFVFISDYATSMALMTKGKVAYLAEPVAAERVHGGQGVNKDEIRPLEGIEHLVLTLLATSVGFLEDPKARSRALLAAINQLVRQSSLEDLSHPWTPIALGLLAVSFGYLELLSRAVSDEVVEPVGEASRQRVSDLQRTTLEVLKDLG